MLLTSVHKTSFSSLNVFCCFHYIILRKLEVATGQNWPMMWGESFQPFLFNILRASKTHTALFVFESHLNHCFLSVSIENTYRFHSVANELEASFLTAPTAAADQQEIWILTTSFRHHVTARSCSFPYRALRMASFLTTQADENKGNCILKRRPSCNPHNSCCLRCKYFRG